MTQTRARSAAESLTQTLAGYVIAVATQYAAFPLFGIPHLPLTDHLALGAIFLCVSAIRQYAIRRAFNAWEERELRGAVRTWTRAPDPTNELRLDDAYLRLARKRALRSLEASDG